MADNFDFLKKIDDELYRAIIDAEKLFRDEYFNQSIVQLRIFSEKMAKKILGSENPNMTFDDTLNCLKDKIKTQREQEFIEDLFFIKKQGNKCAHGEDILASDALEAMRRAFEISINYAYSKTKDEKIDKLQFDHTLLITGKPQKEMRLVDKYVQLATEKKEELLNSKQGEFNSKADKNPDGLKDESYIQEPKKYKEKKVNPTKEKIKSKIKEAKKNLKQNINKKEAFEKTKKEDKNKTSSKPSKPTNKTKKNVSKKRTSKKTKQRPLLKFILFMSFVIISLLLIFKMLCLF